MTEINKLYIEKYRSTSLEDLVIDPKYRVAIESFIRESNLPNFLLFSQSPGTGKTSTAKILINMLQCDSISLNASNERGIDTVREKVNSFCHNLALNNKVKKCVFLDEADYLTPQAQASLRNLMEEVSSYVFFILTANFETKVIEPLRSRCFCINYNNPPKEQIYKRLNDIVVAEDIQEVDVTRLIELYYPDIRKMVLTLQLVKQGIKVEDLFNDNLFKTVLKEISVGNFHSIKNLVAEYNVETLEFIHWVFEHINKINMPMNKTAKLCEVLCDMEKNIVLGVPSKLVLFAYLERLKICLNI